MYEASLSRPKIELEKRPAPKFATSTQAERPETVKKWLRPLLPFHLLVPVHFAEGVAYEVKRPEL